MLLMLSFSREHSRTSALVSLCFLDAPQFHVSRRSFELVAAIAISLACGVPHQHLSRVFRWSELAEVPTRHPSSAFYGGAMRGVVAGPGGHPCRS